MTETSAPLLCVLCRFPTELDDAIVPVSGGRCICLRCYEREVGDIKTVPKPLQRDINREEPS